ncbi:MAG: NAD-dependent epimerase/dehydratase family protein [Chloroflexi bacterium]|nr:NAD-dependent epimerase/dehydratase family protein [Chloroflexota bacterium]TDI87190.1 MAG: NAD-dependent epimerase/dehydratase family protein [Chloroflexota bacterium]
MKVFVTGATGYVGTAIVKNLTGAGHTVLGMARSDESAAKLQEQGLEVHRGELADPESMAEGAKRADAVIHTAFPQMGPDVNFEELLGMMTAAVAAMVDSLKGTDKTFILTSGAGGYGDTGTTPVDESMPIVAPTHAPNEQKVMGATEEGVRTIVIRPTIVYGYGASNPIMAWFNASRQMGGGVYIGEGDAVMSSLYIDDLAELYRLALEKSDPGEAYNAADGSVLETKVVAEAISHAAGLGGKTVSIPLDEVEKVGFIGRLIGTSKVVSIEKAKRVLSWNPSGPSLMDELSTGSYAS